jgi:ABC-type antimicrobial peptide transport system permease subunit
VCLSTRKSTAFGAVRQVVRQLDSNIPIYNPRTMDHQMDQSLLNDRLVATLSTAFGVLATLLAVIGLYGVMAYTVARRTREIGVRMALGAQSSQVLWLMMRQALWQLAVGLPIGVAGAFAVGRLLQSVLAQTNGRDPVTVAAIAVLMATVSIAACFWPARRATRLDPVAALRNE